MTSKPLPLSTPQFATNEHDAMDNDDTTEEDAAAEKKGVALRSALVGGSSTLLVIVLTRAPSIATVHDILVAQMVKNLRRQY